MKRYEIISSASKSKVERELTNIVNDTEDKGDTIKIINYQVSRSDNKTEHSVLVEIIE